MQPEWHWTKYLGYWPEHLRGVQKYPLKQASQHSSLSVYSFWDQLLACIAVSYGYPEWQEVSVEAAVGVQGWKTTPCLLKTGGILM